MGEPSGSGHMTVRRATRADLPQVNAIYDDVMRDTEGKPTSPLWVKGLHPSDQELDQAVSEGALFVGELDGKVAAVLIANHEGAPGYERVPWTFAVADDEVAVVHLFAVSPRLQQGGVGTRFIRGVFDLLRAEGNVRGVRLDTLEQNTPARRFYAKLGMNYLGVHTLAYHDPRVTRFHMFDLEF